MWENPLPKFSVVFMTISVHENILFARMAVKVAEEQDLPLLLCLPNQLLDGQNHRVLLSRGILPLSIQVLPDKRAPGIPKNHAIWIDHWYNFENVIVPQYSGADAWTYQVVNDALLHIGSASLSGVHSCGYYDRLLLLHLLFIVSERRNC